MTESPQPVGNLAGGNAKGVFQGHTVEDNIAIDGDDNVAIIDSTLYLGSDELSAEEKFERGLRCLDHGVPSKAREYLKDALAAGMTNPEVYFHLVLAVFSKRSRRELTAEDHHLLDDIAGKIARCSKDRWTTALQATFQLIGQSEKNADDETAGWRIFAGLPPDIREKITRHLELVLSSSVTDALWESTKESARKAQLDNNRTQRAWIFFQPRPAGPRARQPIQPQVFDHTRTIVYSVLGGLAILFLGWLVVSEPALAPIAAYLISIPAAYLGGRAAFDWKYRAGRLAELDRIRQGLVWVNHAPQDGFTDRVRQSFEHYFGKFRPPGVSAERWLEETEGVRHQLSDELAEIYREQRVTVGQINWLIRFLAQDVRDRYTSGQWQAERDAVRVSANTQLTCVGSLGVAAVAALVALYHAVMNAPVQAVIAIVVAAAAGRVAVPGWWTYVSERRRYADDLHEYTKAKTAREIAYQEWARFLRENRPSEAEMEAWLNADRAVLLDRALNVYKLRKSDVVEYSFLLTPARPCQSARARGGPARYSRYNVLLVLVSRDGVREFGTELQFTKATFVGEERRNYRFDAISSVDVTRRPDQGHSLSLTLTNGPTRPVEIPPPRSGDDAGDLPPIGLSPEELDKQVASIDLDMAGFQHTLHLLEGIAAEGRRWLDRTLTEARRDRWRDDAA